MVSFDDDRSCSSMNGSGCQLQVVISALTNIRRRMNMHINDAIE